MSLSWHEVLTDINRHSFLWRDEELVHRDKHSDRNSQFSHSSHTAGTCTKAQNFPDESCLFGNIWCDSRVGRLFSQGVFLDCINQKALSAPCICFLCWFVIICSQWCKVVSHIIGTARERRRVMQRLLGAKFVYWLLILDHLFFITPSFTNPITHGSFQQQQWSWFVKY